MKKVLLVIPLIFFTVQLNAQIMFQKLIGGSSIDHAKSVKQTNDGGYIIAGSTMYASTSSNDADGYLVKTDSLGEILWTKTFGTIGAGHFTEVSLVSDGGYIIVGGWPFYHGVSLIKTDSAGNLLWHKCYDDFGTGSNEGYSVLQTTDGGYVAVASVNQGQGFGMGLIKTDSLGNTLWTRHFGDPGIELEAYSVDQANDGGYIMAGSIYGTGFEPHAAIVKTDSSGNIMWTRTYRGDAWGGKAEAYSVRKTVDGGYVFVGFTENVTNLYTYLVKIDSVGAVIWSKILPPTVIQAFSQSEDYSMEVRQTSDGGYIVCGSKESGLATRVFLCKTNSNGQATWTKSFGGTAFDLGYSVEQTNDGGYIVAGITNSFSTWSGNYDIYLIKTDSLGNSGCNEQNLTGTGGPVNTIGSTFTMSSVSLVSLNPSITDSSWGAVISLCPVMTSTSDIDSNKGVISIFPNPANTEIEVESAEFNVERIEMYNVVGERVLGVSLTPDSDLIGIVPSPSGEGVRLDVSSLRAGIYFVAVTDEKGNRAVRKVVKM